MPRPKHEYDCPPCKFNWNCGYTCSCILKKLPPPPLNIRQAVNEALIKNGYEPEFKENNKRNRRVTS